MSIELTDEQAEMLAAAISTGSIILTAHGCDNDVTWGQLSDLGLLEPADAPKGLECLSAWAVTDAGEAFFSARTN